MNNYYKSFFEEVNEKFANDVTALKAEILESLSRIPHEEFSKDKKLHITFYSNYLQFHDVGLMRDVNTEYAKKALKEALKELLENENVSLDEQKSDFWLLVIHPLF